MGGVMELGKEKFVALLLSGLICPGAGQIYLGRKLKGVLIILSTLVLFLYPVILFFVSVIRAAPAGQQLDDVMVRTVYLLSTGWAAQANLIINCFIALLLL